MSNNTAIREKIKKEVESISAYDQLEADHIKDITDWIDSGVGIFRIQKPDVPIKHLVSYFVLIDPEHKSMLLVDHIKAQLWLPSGGHVELNEDPRETVRRESLEELNQKAVFLNNEQPLFATVTKTVGLTAGHTDVSLWYGLRGDIHQFIDYDRREFNDVEWFTFDEILESDPVIFDPHLQRFTKKLALFLQTS